MKNQYFAVSGRFHGDDEATSLSIEAIGRDEAVKDFKDTMCSLRNLEPDEREEVLGDDPSEHMQVYIDAVFRSAAPIVEMDLSETSSAPVTPPAPDTTRSLVVAAIDERDAAVAVLLELVEKLRAQAPEFIADNISAGWGMNRLRRALTLFTTRNAVAHAEALPCAVVEEIGSVMMQDVVGSYDSPDQVPEWTWVQQHSSFDHRQNGVAGVWEFVLNMAVFQNGDAPPLEVPPKLKGGIQEAQAMGLNYLIFHQGT